MKQKQVKQAAKQTRATRNQAPPKVEVKEEEPVEEKVVPKKAVNKKAAPVQEVIEVKKEEIVEEEDEQPDDDAAASGEEEDQNEDEGMEVEDGDEQTDTALDNEEPTIPSKVKSGEIPPTVPFNRIIQIKKLPKICKQIDIVEVFGKYGAIDQIHIVTTPAGTMATLAYKKENSAKSSLAANKKVKVKDSVVEVNLKKPKKEEKKKEKFDVNESRDRTVYIRYLKQTTTEEQIREHFEGCGEIERIKLVVKTPVTFAFVTFIDASSVVAAKKLHNSVLNEQTIGVFENTPEASSKLFQRDPKLTITLKNIQKLENIEGGKLEQIFSKCGEIKHMDVLCKKNILAFITFETEEAVAKAFKLNDTTEENIELHIDQFNPDKKRTAIYISNLPRDATEEELTELFSRAGEIANVVLKKGFAIINFVDSDAYCKSFLLNESYIKNNVIFVEPHSVRKQTFMKSKMAKLPFHKRGGGYKRHQNGNSVFTPKKAKNN